MYLAGAAPCGALDLSGNVWEWCLNEHTTPTNIGIGGNASRNTRGGSWINAQGSARTVSRLFSKPDSSRHDLGFRLVVRPRMVEQTHP